MVSIGPLLGQPTGARLSGLTSHPNSLAFSLTLALPVVFYFLGSASSFWGKLTWMLSGGVLVWALALTGSRAGLLVGIPIIVISFVSLLWSSRARLLVIPILIIGGILLAWWLPQALESTRLIQGALDSDSGRVSYNSDAWRVFADNPVLGGGFANMRGVSVPLMVLSAGGIVLFVAYYAFAFRSLPVLWRARSTLLARTGAFTLIAFIGFGALNPVWMERATYWPTLIAALCVLISQQSAGARGNPWVGATHSRWLSARPQSGSRSVGSLRGASAQSETPVL